MNTAIKELTNMAQKISTRACSANRPSPNSHVGLCVTLVFVSLSVVSFGSAADPTLSATLVTNYSERWERDKRRGKTSKPNDIINFIGIESGMEVLDLYSGGGYWSELFARVVGSTGKVVAHTNTAYRNFAGALADARFDGGRVADVEIHHAEANDLMLGEARFDLIFIGLGYHDLYFYADFSPLSGRDYFFAQLYAALKPGGKIAIIDHAATAGTGPKHVQSLHRIDEEFARQDFERAGFTFEAASNILRNPSDDRSLEVFAKSIRHRTDRFVYRFRK